MTTLHVASAAAEESVARLFPTLAAHKTSIANLPATAPARLRGQDQSETEVQERRQSTLIRRVSITESFAAELLWREVEADHSAPTSSPTSKLASDAVIDATSTWEAQQRAYKSWFAIDPNWKPVANLATARNAATHGLGQLTRRQLRKKQSTISLINNANITVQNDRVLLTEQNLDDAAASCRDFIEEIDQLAQQLHP